MPFDLEKYKKERVNQVTPSTVNRELACLKTLYYKAIEWGKCLYNPVAKVKFYKENNQRIRYLEPDEIKRLIEECSEHLRPIVIMALNTGMRLGEILKLKWQDVDFSQKLIYIMDSKIKEKREIHTFASHLVMNGVDLRTVQELMGHKLFNMTLRYAHLSPDHKRSAVSLLGERMQRVVTIWSQDQK